MFVRTPLQAKLFPCDDKYNEHELADLGKSWAQIIKDKVLPFFGTLEPEFAGFFHRTMGRPIKYISLLIVAHIFKEMYDWTDEELLESVRFDKRFEYAFDLPYKEITLCQKTLHNFRALMQEHSTAHMIFDRAAAFIVQTFNIDTSQQRLDSTHIISNMAGLSRLGLFVRVIENFLAKLKKIDPDSYDNLPARFSDRYKKRRGYFADARSKKTKHRLGQAAEDMYELINRFCEHEELSLLKVTKQLERVFNEHCTVGHVENDSTITIDVNDPEAPAKAAEQIDEKQTSACSQHHVSVKDPKEMPSGTLQNPSDEDATFGHKGAGYEATFAETCSKKNPFQVITDVQTDTSIISDQGKTVQVVNRLNTNGLKPDVLYGDGGFTSGENIVECADKGVDLQGNLVGADKSPDKLKLADFQFEPDGITVTACPAGKKPVVQKQENARRIKSKSQQSFLVYFDLETCRRCALQERCPIRLQKKKAVIRFSLAQRTSSMRRREQETKAFKERNNIRAGIESTNAEIKKLQGLDRLSVRGQPKVEQTVIFKALACNIKRMVKYVRTLPKYQPVNQNAGDLAVIPANC